MINNVSRETSAGAAFTGGPFRMLWYAFSMHLDQSSLSMPSVCPQYARQGMSLYSDTVLGKGVP